MGNNTQMTGLAGEFFVAGELFKRGFQVSLTLGNAKSVDIFATHPNSKDPFKIEVKTLTKPSNCYRINVTNIFDEIFYIFVVLNEKDKFPIFYIVPGKDIKSNLKTFFGSSIGQKIEAINYGPLKNYLSRWDLITRNE